MLLLFASEIINTEYKLYASILSKRMTRRWRKGEWYRTVKQDSEREGVPWTMYCLGNTGKE
jgi:hypothetical protein